MERTLSVKGLASKYEDLPENKKLNVVMNAYNLSTQVLAPGCGSRVMKACNASTQALAPGKGMGSRVMSMQSRHPGASSRAWEQEDV